MERKCEQSRAEKLFCVAFFALAFYLSVKYALGIVLPFALGWLLSLAVLPIARATSKRTKCPQGLCAAIYVTLVFFAIGVLSYFATRRIFRELSTLVDRLGDPESDIYGMLSVLTSKLGQLREKFSFIDVFFEKISGSDGEQKNTFIGISNVVGDVVKGLASRVPEYLGAAASKMPAAFISFIITVMSCYYFSMDSNRIGQAIKEIMPKGVHSKVSRVFGSITHALRRYARAYLLIMSITFGEVLVGLLILGVRWAFLIALVIAIIDILPVFGAGTVLIPWSVFAFIVGNNRLGIGLIILYGVVTVIRQLIEPKIIGSSIGMHPIITLFSMYAGLSLFGVGGMILGPAAVLVLKELISGGGALNTADISVEHRG